MEALYPVLRRMYIRGVLFDLNDLRHFKDATVVIVGSFAVCVGMGQVVHRKAGEDGTGGGVPSQAMNFEIAMASDLSKKGERVICIDAFHMSLPADALDNGLTSHVAADMAENMNAVMIYGPMSVLGLGSWVNKAADRAAKSVFGNGTIVQMVTRTKDYKSKTSFGLTVKATHLIHPTALSSYISGNKNMVIMARYFNNVFQSIGSGNVDFVGLAIGVSGVQSDKYLGRGIGGVLGNAISDRYLEKMTGKPAVVIYSSASSPS